MSEVKDGKDSCASGLVHGETDRTAEKLSVLNDRCILTGLSHEMRTHMNAIMAFSFLINNNSSSNEERKEFGDYIINSCEKLIVLFDNFLDSAIIDMGNSVSELRKCNLNDLISDQLSDFRALLAKQDNKSIDLILDDRCIHPADIYIDINKVTRVIRNLLLNALESTNNGYIRIGYNLDSGNVTFYILDSGQGYNMNKSLLGSSADCGCAAGNISDTQIAVSLILAKKLVALMQGKIWVLKNGLSGTGVYFSLPINKPVATSESSSNTKIKSKLAI